VNRAILSDEVITVARMATTDERVRKLEVRVDVLETWAGPGQTGALADGQRKIRADLAKIHKTQDRHGRLLGQLVSDVDILKTDVAGLKTDVAGLKTDVAGLKTDVAGLKTDVAQLKTDVAQLKTDVAELRSDMTGVKATLGEILRRLPAVHD
jgi:outer membrane murein-binding lipoprotein Lpp